MCKRIMKYQTKIIGDIPFYKIGTFGKEADAYIDFEIYQDFKKKYSFPQKWDILISASGTIGRTVVYGGSPAYFQDSNIVWISNNEKVVSNTFLHYIYKITNWTTEDTTISRLYNDNFRKACIPIPSFTEQTLIATALADIDNLISSIDTLIIKKQGIKQWAMQQLLTGKKRLPGFTGEREERKLGDIVNFYKGKWLSKGKLSKNWKIACLLYWELFTTYTEFIDKIISSTNHLEWTLWLAWDILLPWSTTTVGIDLAKLSALWVDGVMLGWDVNILRSKTDSYNPIYLSYYLTHIKKYDISQVTQWTTIIHLYWKNLSEINLSLPSKEEQDNIIQIILDMDNNIQNTITQRDKYKSLKQGMMQQLLTGKIRLQATA